MGCIVLVHWYDWYQWNIIHSNGIPLVKCISLLGLRIFSSALGCEGVHSTCHWYDWCDWYQCNIIHSIGILMWLNVI